MKKILVLITSTSLLAFGNASYAQTWNAYNDFYLNISGNAYGDGTTLATINTYSGVSIPSSPSSTGSAWGYYSANINGFGGFPNGITSTDDNGGQASSFGPVFLSAPAANGGLTSLVGGAGQIFGSNSIGYANGYFAGYAGGSAGAYPVIGSYNREWYNGSANSQGGANVGGTNSSLLWLQGATFASTPGDGIASVLTWTAPTTGTYLSFARDKNACFDELVETLTAHRIEPLGGAEVDFTGLVDFRIHELAPEAALNGDLFEETADDQG